MNDVTVASKRCPSCGEEKPAADFYRHRAKPDGLQIQCKECQRAYQREYDRRAPGKKKLRVRRAYLKRRYGLTVEQYELLLFEQNGRCALCQREMGVPHIDHDHSCCPGRDSCGNCIRALLCFRCNALLGTVEDTELLLRAVSYLDSFKK